MIKVNKAKHIKRHECRCRCVCTKCPFPFSEMDCGDWFELPVTVRTMDAVRNKVYAWMRKYRREVEPDFMLSISVQDSSIKVTRY